MEERKQYFAIAVYRCLVSGAATGSLDVQVRYFLANSEDEVRSRLSEEDRESYLNTAGEAVEWQLRAIMAVEEFGTLESGEEIVGFIANQEQIQELAGVAE